VQDSTYFTSGQQRVLGSGGRVQDMSRTFLTKDNIMRNKLILHRCTAVMCVFTAVIFCCYFYHFSSKDANNMLCSC
jgi:hypothetical protein